MKRMTFVISDMTAGGAQRVMATMANHWAARGWDITLITFDDGAALSFFPLHGRIRHLPLGTARPSRGPAHAVKNNAVRILALRRAIRRSHPDAVISFLDTTNVATLLATRGLRLPLIVEEHTDPSQKRLGRGWSGLRTHLYPRASKVVVLSEQARGFFDAAARQRTTVIPNPIEVAPPSGVQRERAAGKTLIALGRLGPEKGFDLLLEAFAQIAANHPDWRLVIWGDGDCRADLEAMRSRLGLEHRVEMPGRTLSPHDELRAADLFVLSSRREGFPMALGEAMACGLAAVSTDCESGPRQIIRHGVDGMLAPPEDAGALAAALDRLMSSDLDRARLAQRAPEVLDRFGTEHVMGIWEDLIDEAAGAQKSRRNRTFGAPRTPRSAKGRRYDDGQAAMNRSSRRQ